MGGHSIPAVFLGSEGDGDSHWEVAQYSTPTGTVSVAGASEGERVCEGAEDPTRGHCWADRSQHLAWWVGSDDLEGMAALGMTRNIFYSPRLSWLQITET